MDKIKELIRDIPDFPIPNILFRDITTLLQSGEGLKMSVDEIVAILSGVEFDLIAGPESRGFIFGVPTAYAMGKGFIPVRKKGKLPYKTVSKKYGLEYGESEIEIHADAIQQGQRVVVVDDLLATGGTSKATAELIEEMGGVVEMFVFLIELEGLGGREVVGGYKVESIVKY
jgi:adenine phosphoribosyltransferase